MDLTYYTIDNLRAQWEGENWTLVRHPTLSKALAAYQSFPDTKVRVLGASIDLLRGGIALTARPCKVTFRLTVAEKDHLKKQAKLAGLKLEPFLRALVMDTKLRERPPEQWVELVRQLSGIGTNINQIAHIANRTGQVHKADLDAIIAMQGEIWRWVKGL